MTAWTRRAVVAAALAVVVAVIGLLTVREAPLWTVDQRWSRGAFEFAERHGWVADAADVFGAITIPTVLRVITLLGAFWLWRRGEKSKAVWWAVTMIVVGAVAIALRYAVARPRPLWPGFGPPEPGYTFPSGHTTSAVAFALCLVVLFRRTWAVVVGVLIAVGVAASRVLVGVHRLSDVLAAAALAGALVAGTSAVAAYRARE